MNSIKLFADINSILDNINQICGLGPGLLTVRGDSGNVHQVTVTEANCTRSTVIFGYDKAKLEKRRFYDENLYFQFMSNEDATSLQDIFISTELFEFLGVVLFQFRARNSGNPSYATFFDYEDRKLLNVSIDLDLYESVRNYNHPTDIHSTQIDFTNMYKALQCSYKPEGAAFHGCKPEFGTPDERKEHIMPIELYLHPFGDPAYNSISHPSKQKDNQCTLRYRYDDGSPVVLAAHVVCGEFI